MPLLDGHLNDSSNGMTCSWSGMPVGSCLVLVAIRLFFKLMLVS